MPNSYYDNQDAGQRFLAGETARGSDVDAKFDAVEAGFDTLPEPNDIKAATVNFSADSGTANNYVLNSTQNYTAYTTGQQVRFIAGNANTGSAVINLDGLGNKSVLRQDGSALRSGDIPSGAMISATYNGTAFLLDTSTSKMLSDAETGATTATTQAIEATNQAQIAAAQASIATTQAGIATTKATEASSSATTASEQADIATTQAGTASTQAGIATTKATEASGSADTATTQAGFATTQANTATNQAGIATAQAELATIKASESSASATESADSATLAQNWATKTDAEVVLGQGYGAKKYAEDAAASAAAAATFDPSSYYTKTELSDGQLDGRYYTEAEVDSALSGKQATLISGDNIKTVNGISVLGPGDLSLSGFNLIRVNRYTSSTTWTKDANTRLIKVIAIGGGGGGSGASTTSSGAGGAGGGTIIAWFDVETLSSSLTLNVGAGGSGGFAGNVGSGGGTTYGSVGGEISFSAYYGNGGRNSDILQSGDGGAANASGSRLIPGAPVSIQGAPGQSGQSHGGTSITPGGAGGGNFLYTTSPFRYYNGGLSGQALLYQVYGVGGTGGGTDGTNTGNGANGTGGVVIIEEYA